MLLHTVAVIIKQGRVCEKSLQRWNALRTHGGGICQGTGHSCGEAGPFTSSAHCWPPKGFPCTQGTPATESFRLPKSGKELTPKNPLKSAQSSGTWKRLKNSHQISSHINDSYKHTHKYHHHPSPHTLPPKRLSSYFNSSCFKMGFFSLGWEIQPFLLDLTSAQLFQQCGNEHGTSFILHLQLQLIGERAFMCPCL